MKLKRFVGVPLIVMAFLVAAVPALASFEISYFNDFQKSLGAFVGGSTDGKCPSDKELRQSFEYDPGPTLSSPIKSNGYADLVNACGSPVWMVAKLTGTGSSLLVQFDAKNIEGCAACVPLVYAGTTAPSSMSQFKADYKGLAATWQKHALRISPAPSIGAATDGPANYTIIAIGFTSLDERRRAPYSV